VDAGGRGRDPVAVDPYGWLVDLGAVLAELAEIEDALLL
jgi:hypothetical protein